MIFLLLFRNVAQPIGRFCGIGDRRQSRSQIGPLGKFSESFWRFSFYLTIFIYGLIILRNVKRREEKTISKLRLSSFDLEILDFEY